MIAMQYTIRLAADFDGKQVHQRVSQRRCLFDDLPGLLHKSFLYNEVEGFYAPFYVWEDDAPARSFLMGDLFRDLVDTFGRPRVRCWSVLLFCDGAVQGGADIAIKELDSIAAETSLSQLAENENFHHDEICKREGLGCHLIGIDPDRWELMRYSTWTKDAAPAACDADMKECYKVLHLSRPALFA
jgi:hypothetical protein